MLKKFVVLTAAASLAAAPALTATPAAAQSMAAAENRNPLTSPGVEIGLPLFLGLGVLMVLLGTGVISDEDDPVSP